MTANFPIPNQSKILSALFEQSNDAIFIIDMEQRYLTVNQRAADLLGYTREALIGMSVSQVIAPESMMHCDTIFQRLLASETVPVSECYMIHQSGARIPTEIGIVLIRDDAGNPLYMQSIVRDITYRKQAENHRLALALEAERSHMLHDFIQAASHEFRTPLTTMNTTLYLLNRVLPADPDVRRRLDTLQEQVDSVDILINRMLLLVQLESDRRGTFKSISLPLCWHAAEGSLYRALNERGVHLTRTIAHDLPRLCGDAEHLTLLYRELLDNAIRASRPGGMIEVTIEQQAGFLVTWVRDQGTGIALEDQPHVFERFFRGDRSYHERGFGLGLSIAQLIVGHHGGVIQFESQPGMGCTFLVILPIESIRWLAHAQRC